MFSDNKHGEFGDLFGFQAFEGIKEFDLNKRLED